MTIQKIKEDILNLRGANVHIFGQPVTLDSDIEESTIDIVEVLNNLEGYEITDLTVLEYNEDIEEYDEIEAENVESYMDFLHENGYLEELKSDNSYNWGSRVSNDFNMTMYKNTMTDEYIVEFSVHRFGDVRANYTESALLRFDNDYTFYEALTESNKYLTVNGHNCYIDIFSDGIEVFNDNDDFLGTVYDIEDVNTLIEESKQ